MSSFIKHICCICLSFLFFIKCAPKAPDKAEPVTVLSPENTTIKHDTLKNLSAPYTSDITCPNCGYTQNQRLPTEVCLLKYTCVKCNKDIFPKKGDCCVFCSYGSVKCPSKQ